MPDRYLSPREIAAHLGVSRGHIYRLVRAGILPTTRIAERLCARIEDVESLGRTGWFGRGRGENHAQTEQRQLNMASTAALSRIAARNENMEIPPEKIKATLRDAARKLASRAAGELERLTQRTMRDSVEADSRAMTHQTAEVLRLRATS